MSTTPTLHQIPAVLGGDAAFPEGLPLTRVHVPDRPALLRRLDEIIASGHLTNGPTVRALEDAVAARLDVGHVVGVSSCTAGLMLAMRVFDVRGPVVMPSFTFSATAHAAHWAGATPVFADVDTGSLTLDPADAAQAAPDAGAYVATHVYGTPCRVEELESLAASRRVPLLFDAAHALGSWRRSRPVGGFGAAEVFSLSPTKVITAGEGGLVATGDASLAEALRIGRDYGNPGDYDTRFVGLNGRMSELHAAVGLASLAELDERVARRGVLVERFAGAIDGVPGIGMPVIDAGDVSTYKDLTVVVDPAGFGLDAPTLQAALKADGIDSRRYFYPAVHRQRAYEHLQPGRDLPVTDLLAPRVLTLPLFSHMDESTLGRLSSAVLAIHEHAAQIQAQFSAGSSGKDAMNASGPA